MEWQAIAPAIPFVEKTLGLTDIENNVSYENEEPDFVFGNDTKSIGIEVIECHPSLSLHKKDNAPALEGYKNGICKLFLKNMYLESITKDPDKNYMSLL